MNTAGIRKKYRAEEIRQIENKYGLMPFRMGLTHLYDVGYRNLTPDTVEAGKAQIMVKAAADTSGKIPIMTPEFQCQLLDIALELRQFSLMELMAYVKTDFAIG